MTNRNVNLPYILIGGDISPIGLVAENLEKNEEVFDQTLVNIFKNSIVTLANLEAPVTLSSNKVLKSGPRMKGHPSILNKLKNYGINGFFLANNHIMDYGKEGLRSTIKACEALGIKTIGAGKDLESAKEPLRINNEGVNIAIFNFAEEEFGVAGEYFPGYAPLDLIENTKQIIKEKEKSDIIILSIHGGLEYFPYPRPGLRDTLRYFIEIGVDAIVCHHTHIASVYETWQGKPIYYGVGNLLFNKENPDISWSRGYLTKLNIDVLKKKLISSEIIGYHQEKGVVKALDDKEMWDFNNSLRILNVNFLKNSEYFKQWDIACKSRELEYLCLIYFPLLRRPVSLIKKIPFLKLFLFPLNRIAMRLNLMRCPSHLEVLQHIHKKRFEEASNKL